MFHVRIYIHSIIYVLYIYINMIYIYIYSIYIFYIYILYIIIYSIYIYYYIIIMMELGKLGEPLDSQFKVDGFSHSINRSVQVFPETTETSEETPSLTKAANVVPH